MPRAPRTRTATELPSRREATALYYRSARRAIARYGFGPGRIVARLDDRPVFVVGSPRSGTSFTAHTLGSVPGFADLGELRPLKRVIPVLAGDEPQAAARTIRSIMSRAQRWGQLAGWRVIEQTPESTYLIPAIAMAYPGARFVHMVRDGRDVASSLVGLGWLRSVAAPETDEVGHVFGAADRFWVEPERRGEFARVSEATRAAWVWRRYESTARLLLGRLPAGCTLEVRYERLVAEPAAVAAQLAAFLDADDRRADFEAGFSHTVAAASGRWRQDLSAAQRADVEAEAGPLLRELGYR